MTSTASKTQDLRARAAEYLIPSLTNMLYYGEDSLGGRPCQRPVPLGHRGHALPGLFRRHSDGFGGPLQRRNRRGDLQADEDGGHTSTLYINEITLKVAEKLAEITPGRLQYSFFTNSGTEADETAIMAARVYTGNTDIIALRHAYSGRSTSMMAMTAHAPWKQGGVYDGTIKHVRLPNMYRRPEGMSEEAYLDFLVEDFEDFLATCTDGKIAAFMAEPIQGVGGFGVVPKDYFKRILPLVKAAGGVLIIDEVQTGWGRTGKYWCGIEHWGVEPDIMTFAKGIANGAPVGATIMTPEIAEAMKG